MHTLSDTPFTDEAPTRPSEAIPTKLLVFATRIDRLAELALERLACCSGEQDALAALDELTAIRELASAVLR